jgi:putative heme-binding domain-containing protein
MNTSPNSQPTNGRLLDNNADIASTLAKVVSDFSRPDAICCGDVEAHGRRVSAKRALPLFTAVWPTKVVDYVGAFAIATLLAGSLTAAEVTPTAPNLNSTPVVDASPEKELASFTIAEGFEVNLFASEKDGIAKPIAHRFDASGRLWVIGSTTYPQVKPGEEPNDYVKIVEDTDGDGKADKVTTFADGLYIPTGLEVDADGRGAWIGEGTKLWHMRDEDGDGKADKKEVVLRGFGTGDNHQNINSFRWSPGGELYMSQGLHAFSHVETPHGVVHLEEAGYFRFNPRTMKLTPFWGGAGDPQNPWGFVWDDWGNLFVQAGNNGSIQDALVSAFEGGCGPRPPQIWEGARGRKASNPEFVGTAHFPPDWQGRLIVPGYINNAVWTLRFSPNGSTFKAVDDVPLIKSSSGSFRPMDAKFAPDGSLYIADWYNPVIGHYQASFRHPDRDKVHGRIWRVTAKGRDLVKPPGFLKAWVASGGGSVDKVDSVDRVDKVDSGAAKPAVSGEEAVHSVQNVHSVHKGGTAPAKDAPRAVSVAEVVKGLESDERVVRDFARRILGAMKKEEVLKAVDAWSATRSDGRAEVEKLCVHQWHETPTPFIGLALRTNDARVRAYATGLFPEWSQRLDGKVAYELVYKFAPRFTDESDRVRLAATIAAARLPSAAYVESLVGASKSPSDGALDFARKEAVARLKPVWEPMLAKPDKGGLTEEQIAFLKNPAAAKPAAPKADPIVAKFVADALKPGAVVGKATPDFVQKLSAEVLANGDAAKGAAIYKRAELGCVACHKIGNDGGTIGPDLNNVGSAQPLDFIIGAVIEPSREIKEGYEARIVTTKSGGTFTGFRRASAPDELALFDGATGKETKLKLTDIADNKPLGSLMPAGLVDKLTREELRDLFAYLTSLGKTAK